jgi:hypothetical protein
LIAAGAIDDRQPAMSQHHPGRAEEAAAIRATVMKRIRNRGDRSGYFRSEIFVKPKQSSYTAHTEP